MQHITEVLQLLNVMDRDHRFETAINEKTAKEAKTMSEWLTRVLDKSKEEGIEEGIEKGQVKGEDELSEALVDLRKQGREADAWKAMEDKQFRAQILEAFRAKRAAATV